MPISSPSRILDTLRRLAACVALSALLPCAASAAEPPLQPGDVLSMTVTGYPDLSRKATVRGDGTVTLPLFGEVRAAGRAMSELRADLVSRPMSYEQQGPSGETRYVTLTDEDLIVDLDARPPVYVDGDVSQPGEKTYKPGLTVRQAVALAGGYDLMRLRRVDPFVESEDLRAQYANLWTTFAEQQARVWRLEAELGGTDVLKGSLDEVPLDRDAVGRIMQAEGAILKARNADLASQRAALDGSLAELEGQVETLRRQDELQAAEVEAAQGDLKSLDKVIGQGLVQSTRISDLRRSIFTASTLRLQTGVELRRAGADRLALELRRSQLGDAREADLQEQLKTARVALQQTRTNLDVTGQKLAYSGLLRSQLVRGGRSEPDVEIHRRGPDGSTSAIEAGEDTELFPGDVVEVSLTPPSTLPGSP